jgi:hypothetical protein
MCRATLSDVFNNIRFDMRQRRSACMPGKPFPFAPCFAPHLSHPQSPSLTRTNFFAFTSMSHTHPTAASSSSPNFQLIINNALDTYKKRTRRDLRTHPLAVQLQTCGSPTAILDVLQEQVQALDQSRGTDERWTKWLDPTINVMYTFSNILGAGVSLVCLTTRSFLRSAPSYLHGRYFHLLASSLPELGSYFQCVYPC